MEEGQRCGPFFGGEVAYDGVVVYLDVYKFEQIEVVSKDIADVGGVLLHLTGGFVGPHHFGPHFSAIYKVYKKVILAVGYKRTSNRSRVRHDLESFHRLALEPRVASGRFVGSGFEAASLRMRLRIAER